MTWWKSSAAILLMCACTTLPARSAVLPTDLEAKAAPGHELMEGDERELLRNLERLEAAIRHSPQRLVAPELDAYTHRIVERLIGRPAPEIRIYVVRDSTFNAAMFSSGMMLVNTGLLVRVRDEAQFAAVLGHEAGHYFRRHSLDRFRDNRNKSAMVAVVTAAARNSQYAYNGASNAPSWHGSGQAVEKSMSRFSREQESEADSYGIMLLARAGYAPRAASTVCEQLIGERRASAAARGKRYHDQADSPLATHPSTERRVTDLADTADHLVRTGNLPAPRTGDEWNEIVRPYQGMLLHEQVHLNDPGASLYLIENLASSGWTATLRFQEGEVHRLAGDDAKAAAAYAAAISLPDAPAEAWRAHGHALLKEGDTAAANAALDRYLAMKPDAADAAMVLANYPRTAAAAAGTGGKLMAKPGKRWEKLPAKLRQNRWEALWTRNGAQLDRLSLVDGLPDGRSILAQKPGVDQQVPAFRADMSAHDLATMVESSYRINGVAVFDLRSVEPVHFLGGAGIEMRYDYSSGIGIAKKGRCVMRVVGGKFYAMRLDGVASDDFAAVDGEFDGLVAGARLTGGSASAPRTADHSTAVAARLLRAVIVAAQP